MANNNFSGIDFRLSGGKLVFRASLKDSSGAKVTSGTTSLRLYEIQDDGTLKTYDWSDNTFKTATVTTETLALTHRTANNGATNTGLWTGVLATLTGFTSGGVYVVQVTNTGATPESQEREFVFGTQNVNTLQMSTDAISESAVSAGAVTKIQNGLSKPGTAQTITPPADMASQNTLNSVGLAVVALGSPMQSGATVVLAASQPSYAPAKAGDAMTLTSDYDAAKTAASQSSVNAIKTVTDQLATMYTIVSGAGVFTADALANAPSGSGGDAITITDQVVTVS